MHATSIQIAKARQMLTSGVARDIRIRAGLSLAEVGQAVGIHPTTLFYWENGTHRAGGDRAVLLMRFLNRLERELAR